ncbi:acetyltransferase (GNAT) family protein [Ciceribacter lividus]|uniref:Acetyltransferase (GNAT) family protein n=1 Tax=Ciceribacter lividus TaxID=1197950 RepID=A0A6I7HHZ0_9HYPH|nr:GNAT family N-acetyltransferase [Ciceribacter lividus]RCW21105.1 acetyltransferase (GNAT) family protein [Ciceribacter lividus]
MDQPGVQVRVLDAAGVERLIGWANDEGWNPGLADAAAFRAADPDGFLGCFLGDELVAGISAVAYGQDFGFIGLYICRPDHRGKGYGKLVWDAGMARLGDRTIGLDGVPAQQANYARMGFVAAYNTLRWSGRPTHPQAGGNVVAVTGDLVPQVLAYDRPFFPAERDGFLRTWLEHPRHARAVLRNGSVHGYAVVRECHDGFKIGPLFADGLEDAKALVAACAAAAGGGTLHIDVPVVQEAFAEHLWALGFEEGFATKRMYRGPAPDLVMNGIFGITTLELG